MLILTQADYEEIKILLSPSNVQHFLARDKYNFNEQGYEYGSRFIFLFATLKLSI